MSVTTESAPTAASTTLDPLAAAALAILVVAAATLGGAWYFELALGIKPCPLCLEQRYAYYVAIPLAALLVWAASRGVTRSWLVAGLALLSLAMFANAGLGVFHSGVEWGWWSGPTDCSGPIVNLGGGNLLESLKTAKVIRCDEVQWRFLGLSLAGYNVMISLALACVALFGIGANSRKA